MRDRAGAASRESLNVNFAFFFQRDRISQSESSRGYRLSRVSARFRRIFISRAKRLGGMLLSVGQEDAEKRKFFRSEGNHVYGAKGVLSLALQKRS